MKNETNDKLKEIRLKTMENLFIEEKEIDGQKIKFYRAGFAVGYEPQKDIVKPAYNSGRTRGHLKTKGVIIN